jgi:hypothetical protein
MPGVPHHPSGGSGAVLDWNGAGKHFFRLTADIPHNIPALVSMLRSYVLDYVQLLPGSIRRILGKKYWDFHRERIRRKILHYYSSRDKTAEEASVMEYLASHPLQAYPYRFVEGYRPSDVSVEHDSRKGLPYATYHGRRLYYPRGMSDEDIRISVFGLLMEQDPASPHRYLTPEVSPNAGDVVADIGAAEGTFSLDVVEQAGKVYLFEPDTRWHEPLGATFESWSEKVVMVPAAVSDVDGNGCLSLDRFFYGKEPEIHFLKVDVEGAEQRVLAGARRVLTTNHPQKGVICTYHHQDDCKEIRRQLQGLGFATSLSAGYMINYWDGQLGEPYLRRALIRFTRGLGV